jgi:photosystem II stability/assembly factor-like uncharacterized protein
MTSLRKTSIAALGVAVIAATAGAPVAPATAAPPTSALVTPGVATPGAPSGQLPFGPLSFHGTPEWRLTATGVTARLRGLSAVSDRIAWAAGTGGTIIRTVDGGRSWQRVDPPGTQDLQFRDIEAFDDDHAVALSIGEGEQSRVYATRDGGRTWTETFRNDDPRAFYDCITFLDRRHGLALSDPVDGRFRILATDDGGRSWQVRPAAGMPDALAGEFAFAASGSCLVSAASRSTRHGRLAWFATGGAAVSRVFATADGGWTWTVSDTAIPSGPSAGIYSLAFRDSRSGLAVGGDYAAPTVAPDAAASTRNRGRNWTLAARSPGEYRSGVTWVSGRRATALAVGPTGSDITVDGGRTWTRFDTGSFDAVACAPGGGCWASGEQGRVAYLR